jgi:hypothetical protein
MIRRKARTQLGYSVLGAPCCIAFAALLSACGSDSKEPASVAGPLVLVGKVDGTDVRVGVVTTASRARLYFCGTGDSLETWTRWLSVDRSSTGEIGLSDADAWKLRGSFQSDTLAGSVAAKGFDEREFHAVVIQHEALSGLYEANAPCGKVGLIVSMEGASGAPLTQGACTGSTAGDVEQVIPILPVSRGADGAIAVTIAGDSQVLQASPAQLVK